MRLQRMLAAVPSGNSQLFIAVVEVLLGEVEAVQLQHLAANRGRGTVTADHHFGVDQTLRAIPLVADAELSGFQIYSRAALLKMNVYSAAFSSIHDRDVQVGAGNGIDYFPLGSTVGLEAQLRRNGMHHSPLHGITRFRIVSHKPARPSA